jgi:hypothetical protein
MRTPVDGAVLLFLLPFAITPQLGQSNGSAPTLRDSEFFAIMKTVSDGWNEGNASKAAQPTASPTTPSTWNHQTVRCMSAAWESTFFWRT